MPLELSELGYGIVDSLADGPEPLSYLLRETQLSQCELATIISTIEDLLERQIARYFGNRWYALPTSAEQAMGQRDIWLELTDFGQTTWAIWRQTHNK